MHVDISCQKCGQRRRMGYRCPSASNAAGNPTEQELEDYLHLLRERLSLPTQLCVLWRTF